jgi:hypothetical protein
MPVKIEAWEGRVQLDAATARSKTTERSARASRRGDVGRE